MPYPRVLSRSAPRGVFDPEDVLRIHLAETGHAVAVIPGLLLAAVPPPAARVRALPGRPHRKLTTGVRSGAAGDPAIRAFRTALGQAVRSTTENAPAPAGAPG
jgi:hypothetical protein